MNHPYLELETLPTLLQTVRGALPAELRSTRPEGEPFAFVEHCWHLADLEREAFAVRMFLLRNQTAPFLPDFDGERAAHQRRYLAQDAALGISVFRMARAANL